MLRRGEAFWKERSVIRKEDDVDWLASVTKNKERVLRGGGTVMRLGRYDGWVVVNFKVYTSIPPPSRPTPYPQ